MKTVKIRDKLKIVSTLSQKGLVNVMGSSILNKVISLLSSVLIVRILSKVEYGSYSWAYNIVSIFILFNGLGIQYGIVQFCSEIIESTLKKEYYKVGLIYGSVIGIIISATLLVYSIFGNLSLPDGRGILISLSFIPLCDFLYNYSLHVLRSNLQNKEYSRATNINSILHSVLMIGGALICGIRGYLLGFYLSYIGVFGYLFFTNRKKIIKVLSTPLKKISEYKEIYKYSLICMCNVAISQLLYILDVFLIGIYISDPNIIASYKASTTIPTAMQFVTSSIILVVYPYFARNKDNIVWVKQNTERLLIGLAFINIPIGVALFAGAGIIVNILYGNQYMDAVPIFRVLAISYIIITMIRIPCGNILAMLRKVKVNLITTIICGSANIVLDIILINKLGSIGAAYATVCVVVLDSIISGTYLFWYLNIKKGLKTRDEEDGM